MSTETPQPFIDENVQCPKCYGPVEMCYTHWNEVKDHCKGCNLYFIYNNGFPRGTIEIVDKAHYGTQTEKFGSKTSDWLTNRKELLQLFTIEEIDTAIEKLELKITSLTTTEDYENNVPYGVHKLVQGWHNATVTRTMIYKKKEWKTDEVARVRTYMVQSNYQSHHEAEIIREILLAKHPWLKEFVFEAFAISGEGKNYEIYIETEFGSLYTPYAAIQTNSTSLITKRMETYWNMYRDGRNLKVENEHYKMNRIKKQDDTYETLEEYNARQQAYYDKEMKPLESKEFQRIKEIFGEK